MRFLVLGDQGFIGRNFSAALSKLGQVTGVDLKSSLHASGNFQAGVDCREWFKTNREKYDLVIHAAAIVGGRQTIDDEPLKIASDLAIDADMFNWALSTGQERVVYFSSSAAYPIDRQQHVSSYLREEEIELFNPREPDSLYGWTKLTGERLAYYVRQRGLKVYVVRPFSGYGMDQSLDYPFPSFIDRAFNCEDPFVIWGDGKQVRDFIHVDDIVNAVFKMVELDIEGPVNLGTSIPTSFVDLASKVCKVFDYSPNYKFLTDKPVGVRFRVADSTQLRKFYVPRIKLDDAMGHIRELLSC